MSALCFSNSPHEIEEQGSFLIAGTMQNSNEVTPGGGHSQEGNIDRSCLLFIRSPMFIIHTVESRKVHMPYTHVNSATDSSIDSFHSANRVK